MQNSCWWQSRTTMFCTFFFSPCTNSSGKNVRAKCHWNHGHCAAGWATVLPGLWDWLPYLSWFLHCQTAAKQSILSYSMGKAGIFRIVAALHLWQYGLSEQMPELSLIKAINWGNTSNFLASSGLLECRQVCLVPGVLVVLFPTLTSMWVLLEEGLNSNRKGKRKRKGKSHLCSHSDANIKVFSVVVQA